MPNLNIRATEKELDRWRAAATSEGFDSVSSFVRECLDRRAAERERERKAMELLEATMPAMKEIAENGVPLKDVEDLF